MFVSVIKSISSHNKSLHQTANSSAISAMPCPASKQVVIQRSVLRSVGGRWVQPLGVRDEDNEKKCILAIGMPVDINSVRLRQCQEYSIRDNCQAAKTRWLSDRNLWIQRHHKALQSYRYCSSKRWKEAFCNWHNGKTPISSKADGRRRACRFDKPTNRCRNSHVRRWNYLLWSCARSLAGKSNCLAIVQAVITALGR